MAFGFLSSKHPIRLARRPYLSFLEFISCGSLADRSRRFVGRNPGIDPLGSCPDRCGDDSLDRNRAVERIWMKANHGSYRLSLSN